MKYRSKRYRELKKVLSKDKKLDLKTKRDHDRHQNNEKLK